MSPPAQHGAPQLNDIAEAFRSGDSARVLELTEAVLEARPGDDAAHEYRARALLALGRVEEAESHAADAVRLDPDEVRYRELLAEVLSRAGAHRDAAAEFGRLARNDPHQSDWTVAEARERIDAAQPGMGVDPARRAVRLDPGDGRAQLTLAQALTRTGDARGAVQAAVRASELLPGDLTAREAVADALWLAGRDGEALAEFRRIARRTDGAMRDRIVGKARTLYRRRAGVLGRLLAGIRPLFEGALVRGWLRIEQ